MDRYKLPTDWVWTTLGEIRLDIGSSVTPNKSPNQIFELYSVPSFENEKPEVVRGEEIGSSKKTVEPNTVLLCKINPRINRVWIVGHHSNYPQIASTEWIPFFPIVGINPKFLRYFMNTVVFAKMLHNMALRSVSEAKAVGLKERSPRANLARRALPSERDGFSLAP